MTFVSTTGTSRAAAPGPTGTLRMTPGRWLALAIGVPVALTLIGWTGFSLVTSFARGSYTFSDEIPVQDHQVALHMNSGNVTLREGSGGSTAWLTGVVQYGLVRPGISEYTSPGGGTDLDVNCDGIAAGNCGVNATLDVPAQIPVALWSNGGDITASGFSSGVTLWAAGGNVSASNLGGNLRLNTGGGDLTGTGLKGQIQITAEGGNVSASYLDSTSGPVQINTGGGDLTANGIEGDVSFTTYGGNVNGDGLVSQQAIIQSGGGDVALAFSQPPQNVQITAYGGNVTLILPPAGTGYDISTTADGGNTNIAQSLQNGTSPDKITINSGGGDITVSQS